MKKKTRVFNVTSKHIGQDSQKHGGRPYILGTDVRVQDVFMRYDYMGKTPEEVGYELQISMVQVFAALTFAHVNHKYFIDIVEQDQNNEKIDEPPHDDELDHRGLSGY